MGPRSGEEAGQPWDGQPVKNLRQGAQCPLQAYSLAHMRHTGDTLITLSTPQWVHTPSSLGDPREHGRGFSTQAKPNLRQVLPSGD